MPLRKNKSNSGSGKKKSKKPKKSKGELAKEKLDKAAEAFTATEELHEAFVARINKWMIDNYSRAIDLFRRFDIDGDGKLTYEEFYAGMRDLGAPANSLELYVLAKRLDSNSDGSLDYLEFSKGMKYYRKEKSVPRDTLPVLTFEREKLENCPCCKIGLWKPAKEKFPRFICLELKLLTFANLPQMKTYPGHFQVYVHSYISVQSVESIIQDRFGGTTTKIDIFGESNKGERVKLDPHKTLQDCGFPEGPRHEPQLVELMYDYATEFSDCPLLMCDHYFKVKTQH